MTPIPSTLEVAEAAESQAKAKAEAANAADPENGVAQIEELIKKAKARASACESPGI